MEGLVWNEGVGSRGGEKGLVEVEGGCVCLLSVCARARRNDDDGEWGALILLQGRRYMMIGVVENLR